VGWFPTPESWNGRYMDQPSDIQNRTTVHPFWNQRQRHPTNPIKQYGIPQFFEENPSGKPGEVPPTDHGKPSGDTAQLAATFESEGTLNATIMKAQ
jgi:hypothetical protein